MEREGDDLSPLILTVCQIRGQGKKEGTDARGRAAEAGSTMRFLNSNKRLPPAGRTATLAFFHRGRGRPPSSGPPSPFDRFLPLSLQPFFVINHFPKRKVHGASQRRRLCPWPGLRTTSYHNREEAFKHPNCYNCNCYKEWTTSLRFKTRMTKADVISLVAALAPF